MLARCVHRSRNVVSAFVLLLLVGLLLVGFLVLTVGSASLSSTHSFRADGGGLPPICCPNHDASIPAMRADGLPPIPPVGPGLAQSSMAVVD